MKNPQVKIYNTLSGKKDALKPLSGQKINLFVCGPTVYDFSHLGHARSYVIFDCFAKYLKSMGYHVFYLQNITDIDDKIIARAKEKGVGIKDLADAFTNEYFKDMKALGVTSVKKYAKATDHIKEVISQVERLIDKKYAYTLEEDGIYFDIAKFKDYGKLSGRTALQAEDSMSRIDYSKNKRNRGDFCLWKFSIQDEPSWTAPFGAGRPGWHIEDTAITEKYFGAQYDVHGGGRDIMFPHHEAEITQMESISGKKPLARYWMHTGFLTIDGQKMSKSLGNFVLINDFLKRYPAMLLRFWVAKNLWHTPMDYSETAIIEAKISLEKIEEFLRKLKTLKTAKSAKPADLKKALKRAKEEFYINLADDFNTPKAFAALFEFIKEINKLMENGLLGKKEARDMYKFFEEINKIFGIIDFEKIKNSNIPQEVLDLVKVREGHRKSTQWNKADEVRKEIEKYGYSVDDTQDGPVVKKIH
ncbi:cysteine--tRNA ligase [Candidatus Parcubacteria bacterium]|nr:cysteine--tRNA ligase [Candidatus Parcubacteria bacterium]